MRKFAALFNKASNGQTDVKHEKEKNLAESHCWRSQLKSTLLPHHTECFYHFHPFFNFVICLFQSVSGITKAGSSTRTPKQSASKLKDRSCTIWVSSSCGCNWSHKPIFAQSFFRQNLSVNECMVYVMKLFKISTYRWLLVVVFWFLISVHQYREQC